MGRARSSLPRKKAPDSDSEEEKEVTTLNASEDDDNSDEGAPSDPASPAAVVEEDVTDVDGFQAISSMTEGDLDTLIEKLGEQCSMSDTSTISRRMKQINWNRVAFEPYSAEECKAAWCYLKVHCRKHRIMREVLEEIKLSAAADKLRFRSRLIEVAPGFPKKPPQSPALLFCKEMWSANPTKTNFFVFQRHSLEAFNKLDESKQRKWKEKLDVLTEQYAKNVVEFYAKYPNYENIQGKPKATKNKLVRDFKPSKERTAKPRERKATVSEKNEMYPDAPQPPTNPQMEYVQSKINALGTPPTAAELAELKTTYSEKWQKLSDRKKMKWIQKITVQIQEYLSEVEAYKETHPSYSLRPFTLKNHLTKADMEIWGYFNEQPKKPAKTVFDHFYEEKLGTPEYDKLSTEDSRKKAEEEFKAMSHDDQEMCRINFRRYVLEYKKHIEQYYDWVPDFLKPLVLSLIPKRFRSTLLSHVDKVSEAVVENDLEHHDITIQEPETLTEPDEDPLSSPPRKKKRKKNSSQSDAEEVKSDTVKATVLIPESPKKKKKKKKVENEGDSDVIEYVDPVEILNGQKKKARTDSPSKKPDVTKIKIPTAAEYKEGRQPLRSETDEIIRGIFDERTCLGRTYSVFYFYARHVCKEPQWMRLCRRNGWAVAAEDIYKTFLSLSNHKKTIFIEQSYEWHVKTKREPEMPGEPTLPPRNPRALYLRDMKWVADCHPDVVIPNWTDLDDHIHRAYMKRLYRDTKEYAKDFENYIMKMSPNELLAYNTHEARKWEGRTSLQHITAQAAWRGFIFPFAKNYYSEDEIGDDSEPETATDLRVVELRRSEDNPIRNTPLQNDDLIEQISRKVVREEMTIEELMADTSSSSSDDSSDED